MQSQTVQRQSKIQYKTKGQIKMTTKEQMSAEEFEQMLQDSYTYKLNVAHVVKGVAVKKEKDGYLVDIGAKTEAFLPIKEVVNFPEQNPDELIKLWEVKEFYVMKDEEDDEVYNARALIRKLNRNDALHLENYSPVSEKISNKIAMELQATKENNDKVGQALVHSGIRNIEESILEIAEEIVEYKLNDDYWEYIQDTDYEKVFQSDLDSENDFEGKTPKWDNVARKWFFS